MRPSGACTRRIKKRQARTATAWQAMLLTTSWLAASRIQLVSWISQMAAMVWPTAQTVAKKGVIGRPCASMSGGGCDGMAGFMLCGSHRRRATPARSQPPEMRGDAALDDGVGHAILACLREVDGGVQPTALVPHGRAADDQLGDGGDVAQLEQVA